jgi:hypothetical protein
MAEHHTILAVVKDATVSRSPFVDHVTLFQLFQLFYTLDICDPRHHTGLLKVHELAHCS